MSNMKDRGIALYNKGYNIVPVEPKDKRVLIAGWNKIKRDLKQVENWVLNYPDHGIGALTKDTPFIDLDIKDIAIGNKMNALVFKLLGANVPIRTGQYPKIAIPCQSTEVFKKQKSNIYKEVHADGSFTLHAIEILADGQMCIMLGIHKITLKDYEWNGEIPNVHDLPVLTQRIIDALFEEFNRIGNRMVAKGAWTLHAYSTNEVEQTSTAKPSKRLAPKAQYSEQEMLDILQDVPYEGHDQWIKIGIALHHQYEGSQLGLKLWIQWSKLKCGAQFNEPDIRKRYPTFNRNPNAAGLTMGTIKHYRNEYLRKEQEKIEGTLFQMPTPSSHNFEPDPLLININPSSTAVKTNSQPQETKYPTLRKEEEKIHPENNRAEASEKNCKDSQTVLPETSAEDSKTQILDALSETTTQNSSSNTNNVVSIDQPKKPKWYQGWFFITSINKYYRPFANEEIGTDAFNTAFAYDLRCMSAVKSSKAKPAEYLSQNKLIKVVYFQMYYPGAARLGVYKNSQFVKSYIEYIPPAPIEMPIKRIPTR